MDEVNLTVPARPEFVHLLRTVVASVAGRRGFSYDMIGDIRIAVDEASAFLLAASPASCLSVRVKPGATSMEVLVMSDAQPTVWPPPGAQQTLAWRVLSGLTDGAALLREGRAPALRLTKREFDRGGQG